MLAENPIMAKHYDFIAIGGGSAGFNAARIATNYAKRVAIIDGAKELSSIRPRFCITPATATRWD
jgi:thioredoxin reductase